MDCHKTTVFRACKKHPELQAILDETRKEVSEIATDNIVASIRAGDVKDSWKWKQYQDGWSTKLEVTGKNGGPIKTQDVSLTEAVKERLGDAFEDAVASATAADG